MSDSEEQVYEVINMDSSDENNKYDNSDDEYKQTHGNKHMFAVLISKAQSRKSLPLVNSFSFFRFGLVIIKRVK